MYACIIITIGILQYYIPLQYAYFLITFHYLRFSFLYSLPKTRYALILIFNAWNTVGYISRNGTRLNDILLVLTFHMIVSTDISRWWLAD